jgi:hypothetical protein
MRAYFPKEGTLSRGGNTSQRGGRTFLRRAHFSEEGVVKMRVHFLEEGSLSRGGTCEDEGALARVGKNFQRREH